METTPEELTPTKARKRIRQPEKWARNVKRQLRYGESRAPKMPTCRHTGGKSFQCKTLRPDDIMSFFKAFHVHDKKIELDTFILKHIEIQAVRRRRPKNGKFEGKKTSTGKCYIFSLLQEGNVPVCQKTFLNVLRIKKGRLRGILNNYKIDKNLPREKRGGGGRRTVKYEPKKRSVINFIKTLKCIESHYCRGKSERKYVSGDLSIRKLWVMYNGQASPDLQVKQGYFRYVFNRKFNIGFKAPQTDVCSTCLSLVEKIRKATSASDKQNFMTSKRLHKLRAKAFFLLLKEKRPNLLTMSFDMQKNLPVPKVPDQAAYYSRQLYVHNFTLVVGDSKAELGKANCFGYCWTEDEYSKGSNQVASAIFHRLSNTDMSNVDTVRLVCDGCGGQNKNQIIFAMCSRWLLGAPKNVKSLELVFPVRGHSFLPSDRVFGQIEKKIKRKQVIAIPDEYYSIIEESTTLLRPGRDFQNYDWRREAHRAFKNLASWHFKVSKIKRAFLIRARKQKDVVLVKGEEFYNTSRGVFKSILKKGMTTIDLNPDLIEEGNIPNISKAKLNDVKQLLVTHYGEGWEDDPNLLYFKKVLEHLHVPSVPTEEEIICEPGDEDEELVSV